MGMVLLGLWLFFTGLMRFVPIGEPMGLVLSVLAMLAGILILVGR